VKSTGPRRGIAADRREIDPAVVVNVEDRHQFNRAERRSAETSAHSHQRRPEACSELGLARRLLLLRLQTHFWRAWGRHVLQLRNLNVCAFDFLLLEAGAWQDHGCDQKSGDQNEHADEPKYGLLAEKCAHASRHADRGPG